MGYLKILSFSLNVGIPNSFNYINKDMNFIGRFPVKIFGEHTKEEDKNKFITSVKETFNQCNKSDACFLLPSFEEVKNYLIQGNDLWDCMDMYKVVSPYNPEKVATNIEADIDTLEPNDESLKYLDSDDRQTRARSFFKAMFAHKLAPGDDSLNLAKKQFTPLEKLIVMQFEKMDFFLDLAANQYDNEENIMRWLNELKVVPKGKKSYELYSAFSNLVSLRTNIVRFQETNLSGASYDSTEIRTILNAISSSIPIKVKALEDIIVLMHGVIEEERFTSIVAQYNALFPRLKLDGPLIKLMFISYYIRKGEIGKKTYEDLIDLLIERLLRSDKGDIEKKKTIKKKLIMSFIDIFKGKYEDKVKGGLLYLVKLGCPKRKNGYKILKRILKMVSWKESSPKPLLEKIYLQEKAGITELMTEIAKTFINDKVHNIIKPEEVKLMCTMTEAVLSLFQGKIDEFVKILDENKDLFGGMDASVRNLVFNLLKLVMNKSNVKGKTMIENIGPIVKDIGEWFSKSIQCKENIAGVDLQKLIPLALRVAFGTIFKPGTDTMELQDGVLEELQNVHPFMASVITIYKKLREIKEYRDKNNVGFSNLPPEIKKSALKAINSVISIAENLFGIDKSAISEAKMLMSKNRQAVLPVISLNIFVV